MRGSGVKCAPAKTSGLIRQNNQPNLHMGELVRSAEAAWARGGLINEQTAVIPAPPGGPHYLASFSHIFTGAYAAGYYGYLWAEVLASNVFEAHCAAWLR